jgi:TolB-like protein
MKLKVFLIILIWCSISRLSYSQDILDQELKKLADQLAPKLLKQGTKRVAIINFTNLENQPTALGKALAEMFTIELTNTDIILINRAQFNKLIEENKMMADGFLDEKEVVKLGQLKKVDIIVTGTATPLDKTVMLTLQATDIMVGTVVGGVKGNISRTNAIESLMRDRVGDNIDENNMRPSDSILQQTSSGSSFISPAGDTQIEQPINKCTAKEWDDVAYFGEVCLENRTNIPFEVYSAESFSNNYGTWGSNSRMMIGVNSRNCYGNLKTGYTKFKDLDKKLYPSISYTFNVQSTEEDEEKRKYGQIRITVDGCKITTKVIDKSRIFFDKKKP